MERPVSRWCLSEAIFEAWLSWPRLRPRGCHSCQRWWLEPWIFICFYISIYLYLYIYILGMEKSSQLTKSIIFQRGRKTTNQIGAWYFWVSSIGDVFLCVEQVWPLACFGTSKTTTWDSGSRTQPSESAIGIVKQAWERLGDLSGAEITHSLGP